MKKSESGIFHFHFFLASDSEIGYSETEGRSVKMTNGPLPIGGKETALAF